MRKTCLSGCSRPTRRKLSRHWARRLFLARVRQALPISSISNSLFRRKKHCSKARILNVRPPYARFYRSAIGAVDNSSQGLNNGRKFAQLRPSEQHEFVDAMRQNKVQGWQGPGGSFVYLLLSSDAVDVVYGTMEGYEAPGI